MRLPFQRRRMWNGDVCFRPRDGPPGHPHFFCPLLSRSLASQQCHWWGLSPASEPTHHLATSPPAFPLCLTAGKACQWPLLSGGHSCQAALPEPQPYPLAPWATGFLLPPTVPGSSWVPAPSSDLLPGSEGDSGQPQRWSTQSDAFCSGERCTWAGPEPGLCVWRGVWLGPWAGEDGQGRSWRQIWDPLYAPSCVAF